MRVTKVGSRGLVFGFDDLSSPDFEALTNVFVIVGKKYFFICDTYLGPEIMEKVMTYLQEKYSTKKMIVFNSHSHWDHIWGNQLFTQELIISQSHCPTLIARDGEKALTKFSKYQRGEVIITMPNLTFEEQLYFPEEGVHFFYTPGHTIDSASCYDEVDQTLFVGDNLEAPIPYIGQVDIARYIQTLEDYQEIPYKVLVLGHGEVAEQELLDSNLEYLRQLLVDKEIDFTDEIRAAIHASNLKTLTKN